MIKPYYQDSKVTILNGHVITELQGLTNESIHCFVFSPPYWGLRDYGLEPQVWDDPGGCEHEWALESKQVIEHGGNWQQAANGPELQHGRHQTRFKGNTKEAGKQVYKEIKIGFCQKCNAWRGSLGLEPTIDLYVSHLVQVFREIWRVGRKDCTVWLNLSDSYASQPASTGISFRRDRAAVVPHGRNLEGLKPKDLCGIPWRIAFALQADGWWLRSDICWAKPNPMPESCTDRPTSSHEYIFLLSKSGTPQFWTHRDKSGTRSRPKADYRWVNQITDEEVAVAPEDWKEIIVCPNCQGTGIAIIDLSCEIMGQWMESWVKDECPVCEGKKKVQKWKRINLWRGHDYFYDNEAVREKYQGLGKPRPFAKKGNQDRNDTGRIYEAENKGGRNLRSVWTIATQQFPGSHFATFPERIPEIAIKAGTSQAGCCPECAAPWVRVVERKDLERRSVKSIYPGEQTIATSKYKHNESSPESKTISWRPSCEHKDLKPVSCTVCDSFSGSGRTGIVAKKLGRKAILIELKPEYCEMPLDELRQENIWGK